MSSNRSANTPLTSQVCRWCSLLHRLVPLLHLRLRQDNLQTPKVPQEPDPPGNQTSLRCHARHVPPHYALLPRRSTRLLETLRQPGQRAIQILQLPTISLLHPLHGHVRLLHPPRPTPPTRLQDASQAPPQMDHAHSIRSNRIPPC